MLTDDERTLLCSLVKLHLEHFKRDKIRIDADIPLLMTEKKYQAFLEHLHNKLHHGQI